MTVPGSSEVATRRTSGAAIAADYYREVTAFEAGGFRPDYLMWAHRLGAALSGLLTALDQADHITGQGPGPAPGAPASHRCPANECLLLVDPDKLMCSPHWYMVPVPLRTAMWRAWDKGRGAGSAAHRAAIDAAVQAVNARLAGRK